MNFCIPTEFVNKFVNGLKTGDIDPAKLAEMTSGERRAAFSKFVGDKDAAAVNAEFESKLLLKNQQRGMITWAREVAGLKPDAQRDMVSQIMKLDRVLNPAEKQSFFEDLAAKKLGVGVTAEEAKHISDLAKAVEDARGGERMTYGRAKVDLANYVNGLKEDAGQQTFKEAITKPGAIVSKSAGLAKSLKASLDDSAIFRQGWKTLWTNPNIWRKNAVQSFVDLAQSVGGKAVLDEVNADIVSRPTYDLMRKAKLAVGTIEEAYPSQLPEKIPVLGRLYKASEHAYTAFIYRQRADIFDKYVGMAEKAGVNLKDPKELQSIGKLVNSLTGRGDLGGLEPAANTINNVFFSPRFMKSHLDVLLQPLTGAGGSSFVRKRAAENLVKIIGGTAGVMLVAHSFDPKAVELDPRSSDFGKIRVKDTRFDVTGGMASIATLAARLLSMSSKSTTTRKVTPLNSGKFGAETGLDVVNDFFENKLSPAASVVKDLLKGEDFNGNKPTVKGEAGNLLVPLPITNYAELRKDPNSANKLVAILADALGIGTNTYAPTKPKK